jgi:hypothetical protein
MTDLNNASNGLTTTSSAASVADIKERISNIAGLPLSEHSNEFEQIHAELQKVLAEIDGL